MKKPVLVLVLVAGIGFCSCKRQPPPAPNQGDFVPVVIVLAPNLNHMTNLFNGTGIRTTTEKIMVPAGTESPYPPEAYTVLVPQLVKTQAINALRLDAGTNHYWFRVQF